jgi:hypothetical protein
VSGHLDRILSAEKAHQDAPLQPCGEKRCPNHPGRELVPTPGGYAYGCPDCGRIPCQHCGIACGSWASALCNPCYSAMQRERANEERQQRLDEWASHRRAKDIAVHLEQEVAQLRAGHIGPAQLADVERLAKHADAIITRDFPATGDRHYVDGIHCALAWTLGWADEPELPEPTDDEEGDQL